MTDSYDSLHKKVNEFCMTPDDQPESQRISQAAKEFGLTRDQVREILGLKDLLQFSDDGE
jgi:hypothetical protein